MKHKLSLVAVLSCSLLSCANPKPPPPTPMTETQHSLAEASFAVSQSAVSVAETIQAAHPELPLAQPPDPSTYGMGGLTTIDWSGPIEPLVKQIANAANYRVRVLGNKPAIPVLVTVYAKNVMLGDILRDVGYQCGKRASVVVFPMSKVIELRYAKN